MGYYCECCGTEMKNVYSHMCRREKVEIYRCAKCRLIWAPELEVDKTFKSKLNEEKRVEALKTAREIEFKRVLNFMEKYIPLGRDGLEVGCSYGWFINYVKDKYRIKGIEAEDSVAQAARDKGLDVITGFFPEDVGKGEKYDFIIFNNVWEHINHTPDLIKGCVSLLKPSGYIILTIPLSTGGLYKIAEILERFGRTKTLARLWQLHFHSPHIYYFTKKNLSALMEQYNCKLLESIDMNTIDVNTMKQRFEMDLDEKHSNLKAHVFKAGWPIIKRLPTDKATFIYQYRGKEDEIISSNTVS